MDPPRERPLLLVGLVVFGAAFLLSQFLPVDRAGAKVEDAEAVRPTKPPHIVFIFADDHGWNDIGYHGSEFKTPILDKLAEEGVKFENYYVQPICTPSRSQFLSGRYQIHTGLQHSVILPMQANGLPLEFPTLADKVREAGYSTHAVGKWHVGSHTKAHLPTNRGFDTFYGYYHGYKDHYSHEVCDLFTPGVCGLDLHNGTEPVKDKVGEYALDLFTGEAINIIKSQPTRDKPMFLYLAMQSLHNPLQAPDRFMEPYKHLKGFNRNLMAGMVAALDEAIGDLTTALKEAGIWDDTVLIYSSDNGAWNFDGGSNWPLRGQKETLWEGGIRAIGFAHGNLVKRKGVVSRELMHVSDWFPTLVNLAGGSVEGIELDGFDQWKTITEGKPSPRKEILHNIDPLRIPSGTPANLDTFPTTMRAALRMGDMKLITGDPGPGLWTPPDATESEVIDPWTEEPYHSPKNVWLFNITADPLEKNDLSEDRMDVVLEMLNKLQTYQDGAVPARFPPLNDTRASPKYHNGFWEPWL